MAESIPSYFCCDTRGLEISFPILLCFVRTKYIQNRYENHLTTMK